MGQSFELSFRRVFLWILCLAALAVGLRNFELGLSADGPLFSTIARNIVRTGEWWVMDGNVPDFRPFAEHPHLGYWIQALVFKLLPAADWSARIPGHCFYIGVLVLLFFFVRKLSGERTAVWTILLLWIWSKFSNGFSAGFVDPGMIFFSLGSLVLFHEFFETERGSLALISGVSLGLAIMVKALSVLGFLPAFAVVWLLGLKKRGLRSCGKALGLLIAGLAVMLGIYYLGILNSKVPDFLTIYWSRQMTTRFQRIFSVSNIFVGEFWAGLMKSTYWLFPLVILAFRRPWRRPGLLIPASLTLTYIIMYSGNLRFGNQYFIPIWMGSAWLIAEAVAGKIPFPLKKVTFATQTLAVVAVLVLQYIPFQAHGMPPRQAEQSLIELHKTRGIREIWLDGTPSGVDFINSSRFAWWGDVTVEYLNHNEPVPAPSASRAYVLFWPQAWDLRSESLKRAGWCLYKKHPVQSVWLECPLAGESR